MDVVFSEEAQFELAEIARFIAQDNPVRAESFKDELIDKVIDIGKAPYTYAPLISHPQFRKKSFKGYIILYTIEAETIYVVHIFNSVRDYTKLLK